MNSIACFRELCELKLDLIQDYQVNYKIYSQINAYKNCDIKNFTNDSLDELIRNELNWKNAQVYWAEDFNECLLSILKNISENDHYDFIYFAEEEKFDFLDANINLKNISYFPYENLLPMLQAQILKSNSRSVIFLSHILKFSGICFENIELILDIAKAKNSHVIIDISDSFLFFKINKFINFNNIHFIYTDSLEGFSFAIGSKIVAKSLRQLKPRPGTEKLYKYLYFLAENSINSEIIHYEIQKIQHEFILKLNAIDHFYLCEKNIVSCNYLRHGTSFVFALPDIETSKKMHQYLLQNGISCLLVKSKLVFNFKLIHRNNLNLDFLKKHRKI